MLENIRGSVKCFKKNSPIWHNKFFTPEKGDANI